MVFYSRPARSSQSQSPSNSTSIQIEGTESKDSRSERERGFKSKIRDYVGEDRTAAMHPLLRDGKVSADLLRHDIGLEHAKFSSKINYNLIYDTLTRLHINLNRILNAKNACKKEGTFINVPEAQDTLNCIAVLNHLISSTKDLKLAFLQKDRITSLEEQCQITRKFGAISPKIDIDLLYSLNDKTDHLWIYKSKILD